MINLEPSFGHEIDQIRPGIVIQNDIGNKFSPLTIAVPITSKNLDKIYPFEVFVAKEKQNGLEKDSKILCNQMRSIDKKRLTRRLGALSEELILEMDEALKLSLALE